MGRRISPISRPYRCHCPTSSSNPELEQGNRVLLPPSTLRSLLYYDIDYPMMFQLHNPNSDQISYCGILEFTAPEGTVTIPSWLMRNLNLEDGGIVHAKIVTLAKGTYAKLQPHTKDFLDIANPRAVLETTLRNFSCLHAGGSITIRYNDKDYGIHVLETRPCDAVHIIDTDCEVDFAPPLDYQDPSIICPVSSLNKESVPVADDDVELVHEGKENIGVPFSGKGFRLDGKSCEPMNIDPGSLPPKICEPPAAVKDHVKCSSSKTNGKLVFGSLSTTHAAKSKEINEAEISSKAKVDHCDLKKEETKVFQAFSGKKFSLRG